MTPRKNTTSSSTPSGPVRVRAESNVLGNQRGAVIVVERTPFVDALIRNGHFAVTDDQPTIEPEPKKDADSSTDGA